MEISVTVEMSISDVVKVQRELSFILHRTNRTLVSIGFHFRLYLLAQHHLTGRFVVAVFRGFVMNLKTRHLQIRPPSECVDH